MSLILDRYRTIAELSKGKRVLDIGCVDHTLTNRKRSRWLHDVIRASAASVIGLDYDRESVEQLRREGYEVVCADATQFDMGCRFDVIVAAEVLEHVTNAGGLLAAVRKHLAEDGLLVITTPNGLGLHYVVLNALLGHEIDNLDHVCLFTPRTLGTMLRKCGFEVVRSSFILGFAPQGHRSRLLYALACVKNVCKLPAYLLRPSLCHRFLTVARRLPVPADRPATR